MRIISSECLGFFEIIHEGRKTVRNSSARGVESKNRESRYLFDLFLRSYTLESTDPRDRVYGFLGLVPEGDIADIQVDYSFTVMQAYAQVYGNYIRLRQNLNFLCFASEQASLYALPTWLPAPEKHSQLDNDELERF
ncbi:hypothetical protein F5Y15DRAFT_422944 [Xylariaceae sp. FL0016]|nr:hypothetical protein F5Y15DRAFT_422944 [Xylariaceae sp. FL0016]